MVELAEKLKEGSLSPESVLYSYMGKVSEMYSVQGSSAEAAKGAFNLKNTPFFWEKQQGRRSQFVNAEMDEEWLVGE